MRLERRCEKYRERLGLILVGETGTVAGVVCHVAVRSRGPATVPTSFVFLGPHFVGPKHG